MASGRQVRRRSARQPARVSNGARAAEAPRAPERPLAPAVRLRDAGRPEVVGPHGRLGALWAVATMVSAVAGTLWLALWLGITTGLAGAQVARSREARARSRRLADGGPPPATGLLIVVAGAGAACVTLAAAAGPYAVAAAAGATPVVTTAYLLMRRNADVTWRGLREPLLVAGAAVTAGVAGAAPVLLRTETGLVPVMVLLGYAMAYDAGAYLVGSGAASAWEGPAAGMAAIGTLTLVVAAVLVPPFHGASPWLLGALAAVLAPLGPMIALALSGGSGRKVRVPAVRRLDSLFVLGPGWSVAVTLLLD